MFTKRKNANRRKKLAQQLCDAIYFLIERNITEYDDLEFEYGKSDKTNYYYEKTIKVFHISEELIFEARYGEGFTSGRMLSTLVSLREGEWIQRLLDYVKTVKHAEDEKEKFLNSDMN